MLQTKCVFIEGSKGSDIYLAIVDTINKEFEEFIGHKINSDSNCLELEFNVNNNFKEVNPVFINQDIIIGENILAFVINYFKNEEDTNVKIDVIKINEKIYQIKITNNNIDIFDIEVSKYEIINKEYILEDNNKNKFNVDSLSKTILDHLGMELGFLFNKDSKIILNKELNLFLEEKDK